MLFERWTGARVLKRWIRKPLFHRNVIWIINWSWYQTKIGRKGLNFSGPRAASSANILVTISWKELTKVVYSSWHCLHLFPKENKCLHYCFVKDIARNVILPSVCPQPVRCAVCLYGWILFCCHCKRVVSYSFKVWCLTWRLSNHYSKEKNRNLWNNTFFARILQFAVGCC